MNYKVVYAETLEELEKQVNGLIDKGWLPQGGLAIQMGILYQTMIKH